MNQVFLYKGNQVTFANEGEVMVNATEMAGPFGKEVKQWLDNQDAHDFIHALAQSRNLPAPGCIVCGKPIYSKRADAVYCSSACKQKHYRQSYSTNQNSHEGRIRTSLNASILADTYPSLVKVVRGGTPGMVQQGTWFHKDVAIEFARWLAPEFGIWCNDRILELLQTGSTTLRPKDSSILGALELTVRALREQNEKLEALTQWKEQVNQERAESLRELQQLPMTEEELPEQPTTSKCRQIVNRISMVRNVPFKNIWDRVYSDLYYRYGISIKSYKKQGDESHLRVAERVGCVDKILVIVSELARQYKVEGAA